MRGSVAPSKFIYTNRQLLDLAPATPEGSRLACQGVDESCQPGRSQVFCMWVSACRFLHLGNLGFLSARMLRPKDMNPERKRVTRKGRREEGRPGERRRHHTEATCQHQEAWFPAHAISWGHHQAQPSFKEKGRSRSSSWWDGMCFGKGMWDWKCLAIFRKDALTLSHSLPSQINP